MSSIKISKKSNFGFVLLKCINTHQERVAGEDWERSVISKNN
jgi:hypothetical protein